MGDGVISVDAERDEDVGGAVRDEALHEADGLAGEDARLPAHRDLPDDVRGDWQQAHRQVCTWYREGSRGKEKNQFGELNCSKYIFIHYRNKEDFSRSYRGLVGRNWIILKGTVPRDLWAQVFQNETSSGLLILIQIG